MRISNLLLALLLISSPAFAIADVDSMLKQKQRSGLPTKQGQNPLRDMSLLGGNCTKVQLFNEKVEEACDKAANLRYKNTRSGFWFFLNDYIITFSGMGTSARKISEHKTIQKVDLLLITNTRGLPPKEKYFSDKLPKTPTPQKYSAIGICSWENPYRSVPTRIHCLAKTKKGTFYVEFDHDGNQPKIVHKNGEPVRKKI